MGWKTNTLMSAGFILTLLGTYAYFKPQYDPRVTVLPTQERHAALREEAQAAAQAAPPTNQRLAQAAPPPAEKVTEEPPPPPAAPPARPAPAQQNIGPAVPQPGTPAYSGLAERAYESLGPIPGGGKVKNFQVSRERDSFTCSDGSPGLQVAQKGDEKGSEYTFTRWACPRAAKN